MGLPRCFFPVRDKLSLSDAAPKKRPTFNRLRQLVRFSSTKKLQQNKLGNFFSALSAYSSTASPSVVKITFLAFKIVGAVALQFSAELAACLVPLAFALSSPPSASPKKQTAKKLRTESFSESGIEAFSFTSLSFFPLSFSG